MQTIQWQDGIAEWKGKVSKVFFLLLIDIVYAPVGITKDMTERINV